MTVGCDGQLCFFPDFAPHGVVRRFADRVAKGTNGAVTIDIKPASQLFNLRTSAEAIQLADVAGFPARKAASAAKGKLRGLGYSCYIEACGLAPSNIAGALGARAASSLMAGPTTSRKVPQTGIQLSPFLVAAAINAALDGKLESLGSVTLTAGSTTTVLDDPRLGEMSMLLFSPRSANAAGSLSGLYVSAKANGSFTLAHASSGAIDKTFDYVIIG